MHISQSFAYKMAAKSTGIDTERNYVTVALCISGDACYVTTELATCAIVERLMLPHATVQSHRVNDHVSYSIIHFMYNIVKKGGSVVEWLSCWTQAQKGPGSNRSRDAVG